MDPRNFYNQRRFSRSRLACLFGLVLLPPFLPSVALPSVAMAATVEEAQQLLYAGKYAECAAMAAAEIDRNMYREEWRHLKIKAEMAQGKYGAAQQTVEQALTRFYADSIVMRLLAHEVYLYNDNVPRAQAELRSIERQAIGNPQRYSSAASRVALGRFFLQRGADARQVLELFYDPVISSWPDYVEAHLASAELALSKYDNALAADILRDAPEAAAGDPYFHYLRARAFMRDDPEATTEALQAALEINPRHVDSILLQVDNMIDAEQYAEAHELLEQIHKINPRHPKAWAYEAVLAHLASSPELEQEARRQALSSWSTNPEVDHTIGRKLSEKYRFAEGAAYQRRALAHDPSYTPARMQLSQDLLRLGEEDEGWQMVQEAFAADGYNVVAHNLATLHDNLSDYRVIRNDSFRIRMEAREADLYGARVLELLERAKETLCAKYEVELSGPITVEIFPQQNDFAVRTFGMPGVQGYLGVCFGSVITANSPAALGDSPSNWEAVLWHEFCHVVTLNKSRNKMPRWLSEGISVYEERQENPAWGQTMSPRYREMILSDEMPPVSELSSAFLSPPSPMHLQFAYYQSSLVVQFMVERYGIQTLTQILDALGEGMLMNEALVRYVAPLGRLDAEFVEYATKEAEALAPELTWEEVEIPPGAGAQVVAQWLEAQPNSFQGLQRLAIELIAEERWQEALQPAQKLRELFPEFVGGGSSYDILAKAHRELGNAEEEREVLEAWAALDSDATPAYLRLAELAAAAEDWEAVERNAQRMLAVNPLVPTPHRQLAQAAEALERPETAIDAYRALLRFDTSDPVNAHFRLATLLNKQGQPEEARREVLMALEDAPRFLEAHTLLLELVDTEAQDTPEAEAEAPGAEAAIEPAAADTATEDGAADDASAEDGAAENGAESADANDRAAGQAASPEALAPAGAGAEASEAALAEETSGVETPSGAEDSIETDNSPGE